MVNAFECFACHKVIPMIESSEAKCPTCGSANGQVISPERVKEGLRVGAFYNIDPKTGKPAKRPRR